MHECIVRMEMPESCKKCISTNCIWGKEGSDYLDVIAALQDFRRANNAGFPDFCPIICQLPEGHGRLVDMNDVEGMFEAAQIISDDDCNCGYVTDDLRIEELPTIVPADTAERSET